jgi:hypothetical protein
MPPSGEDNDGVQERLRKQAIARAYDKLLLARKKDALLSKGDVGGSYRHVQRTVMMVGKTPEQHRTIVLVPSALEAPSATVRQLSVAFLMKPWEEAGKKLQDQYREAFEKHLPADLFEQDIVLPRHAPTNDVLLEVFDKSGGSVRGLLTPESWVAWDLPEDITHASAEDVLIGQYYRVEPNLTTALEQQKLDALAPIEALSELLGSYEPMPQSPPTASGSVAS